MNHRFLFGAAALLLASGGATYFSNRQDRAQRRVSQNATDQERVSERVEPSHADSPPTDPFTTALATAAEPVAAATPPAEPAGSPAEDAPADEPNDPEQTPEQRAQLVRLPVISAIRASYPDAAARYHAMRQALARSGPSSEPWTRSASAVFESWSAPLPIGGALDASGARCFVAGCEVEVRFEDRARYEQAAEAFRSLSEQNPAHGGRVQTPAMETSHGAVVASWMMLRPNIAPPDE